MNLHWFLFECVLLLSCASLGSDAPNPITLPSFGRSAHEAAGNWQESKGLLNGYDDGKKRTVVRMFKEFSLKGGRKRPAICSICEFERRRNEVVKELHEQCLSKICYSNLRRKLNDEEQRKLMTSTKDESGGVVLTEEYCGVVKATAIVYESESYDAQRDRYEIALVVCQWDALLENANSIDKHFAIMRNACTVQEWMDELDYSRIIGPRFFIDKEGCGWLVGVSTISEEWARKYAFVAYGGAVEEKKVLTKKVVDGKLEKDFSRDRVVSPIFLSMKRKESCRNVTSSITGKEIKVYLSIVRLDDCDVF